VSGSGCTGWTWKWGREMGKGKRSGGEKVGGVASYRRLRNR
jgi:hypothetical protein